MLRLGGIDLRWDSTIDISFMRRKRKREKEKGLDGSSGGGDGEEDEKKKRKKKEEVTEKEEEEEEEEEEEKEVEEEEEEEEKEQEQKVVCRATAGLSRCWSLRRFSAVLPRRTGCCECCCQPIYRNRSAPLLPFLPVVAALRGETGSSAHFPFVLSTRLSFSWMFLCLTRSNCPINVFVSFIAGSARLELMKRDEGGFYL